MTLGVYVHPQPHGVAGGGATGGVPKFYLFHWMNMTWDGPIQDILDECGNGYAFPGLALSATAGKQRKTKLRTPVQTALFSCTEAVMEARN